MIHLDEENLRILDILQLDGRRPLVEIAASVGINPTSVSRRIDALKEAGILTGIYAEVDPDRIGLLETVYAFVRLTSHEKTNRNRFEQFLGKHPNVIEWANIAGDWDYLLKIVTRDKVQLDKLELAMLDLKLIARFQEARVRRRPFTKRLPLPPPPSSQARKAR